MHLHLHSNTTLIKWNVSTSSNANLHTFCRHEEGNFTERINRFFGFFYKPLKSLQSRWYGYYSHSFDDVKSVSVSKNQLPIYHCLMWHIMANYNIYMILDCDMTRIPEGTRLILVHSWPEQLSLSLCFYILFSMGQNWQSSFRSSDNHLHLDHVL